jgi:hypothetical protein
VTTSELERIGREAGVYFTAADLMKATFPEPRWAVPGLVAEGLNLLVGSPKFGKSWLCLGLGIAVASGGRALGRVPVEQGDVLYCALEDPPRRLQNRLDTVLGNAEIPSRLALVTALPRMPDCLAFLDGWLDVHPGARLVMVDVLKKIRPPTDARASMYESDYDQLSGLKKLADARGVAVLVVHHTRKATDDGDVFNEVSGSTGLTGAADAILIAKRARNTAEGILHVTGRDVTEREYGLSWHPEDCTWGLLDEPVSLASMGTTRRRILDYVNGMPGASPGEIAAGTGINLNTVKSNVRRMAEDNQLGSDGEGRYFAPSTPDATATGATVQPGGFTGLQGLQLQDGGAAA